jgi:alpha/beta superfamily hydrolase
VERLWVEAMNGEPEIKSQVRSVFLRGPAGRLEAIVNTGVTGATHAALVCHPHPLHGGTMHNKVVFHLMKVLNRFGFPVLRFNFRGAGLSEGSYDHGRGEVADVQAALDWLYGQYRLPMIFAGFSFGAAIGLQAACPDSRVVALLSLGTPVNLDEGLKFGELPQCSKPILFLSGDRDRYGPRASLQRLAQTVPGPRKLVFVEDADHFFTGHLQTMQQTVQDWVAETLNESPGENARL